MHVADTDSLTYSPPPSLPTLAPHTWHMYLKVSLRLGLLVISILPSRLVTCSCFYDGRQPGHVIKPL